MKFGGESTVSDEERVAESNALLGRRRLVPPPLLLFHELCADAVVVLKLSFRTAVVLNLEKVK